MGTDIGKERQKIHVNYQMGSHGGGGGGGGDLIA